MEYLKSIEIVKNNPFVLDDDKKKKVKSKSNRKMMMMMINKKWTIWTTKRVIKKRTKFEIVINDRDAK